MNPVLESLARKIDIATDERNKFDLNSLMQKCRAGIEHFSGADLSVCYFLLANCHSALFSSETHETDQLWSWEQQDKIDELLCLRMSVSNSGFSDLDPIVQCKVLTNTAGVLSHLGRPTEAISAWDEALTQIPNFAMALGNKGAGLLSYGNSLYDYGHTAVLASYAHDSLEAAISKGALWDSGLQPDVKQYFVDQFEYSTNFLKAIDYKHSFDLDQWSLGVTEEEIEYRKWCLSRKLFLSPLNDICLLSAAAQDVLHLPDHSYEIGEKPRYVGYFNALKQEYATARHILFEGANFTDSHYADREVMVLNAGDGATLCYRNEQLKFAYRLLYSLLDKVAIFINEYFAIGLPANAVSFRRIWGKIEKGGSFKIHEGFEGKKNWPLRGLFYVSKDLFDDEFNDTSLPQSQDLAKLRNSAEHRFVSLGHIPSMSVVGKEVHTYIDHHEFIEKAIQIAKIAREALIYLSLAVHREEQARADLTTGWSVSVQSVKIER